MTKSLKFTIIILLVILSLCYSSVAVDNIIRTRFRLKRSEYENCPIICFWHCPKGYVLDWFGSPTCKCED
ncbi:unnamed protein product [Gordionus sp. m RMFG-2023]